MKSSKNFLLSFSNHLYLFLYVGRIESQHIGLIEYSIDSLIGIKKLYYSLTGIVAVVQTIYTLYTYIQGFISDDN